MLTYKHLSEAAGNDAACPLHWQVGSSPLDHQGGSKLFGFDIEKYFLFTLQKVEPVYTPTKVYNKDMNCRT